MTDSGVTMGNAINPGEITLDYAPHRRADVTQVEIEGEAVVYEPDGRGVHRLNAVATVLWNCFDGSVTLRELSEDLQEVFEEDTHRVAADVLRYARDLGEAGLLSGIRRADTSVSEGHP